MNTLEIYFVKVNIAIALFYLIYRFALANDTFWTARRVYLVSSILLAAVYPFISLAGWIEKQETVQIFMTDYVNLKSLTISAAPTSIITLRNSIYLIYYLVISFLFVKMTIQLISIYHWKLNGKAADLFGTKIIEVTDNITPFSFFNLIFINPALHTEQEARQILAHEQTHARQMHSLDVLLGELLTIFCWFNPAAWLLKREIRQNLEFLADNKVLQSGFDTRDYQYHLLQLSYQIPNVPLVNKFNVLPIKKRIIMMNQQKTAKAGLLKYSLIVPLALVLVLSSNAETVVNSAKEVLSATKTSVVDTNNGTQTQTATTAQSTKPEEQQLNKTDVYTVVEKMPEYPGGEKKLMEYLAMSLRYPVEAQKNNQQGTTFIQFVVNVQGKVEKAKVLRSVSSSLDQEALRVVEAMSEWIPGEQKGKKVSVYYTLPITFKLDGSSKPAPNPEKNSIVVVGYSEQKTSKSDGDSKITANKEETKSGIYESFKITDNTKPIYFIDEKDATETEVKALNPQNIKEVKVLKDAAATAPYGSRAMGGVVLITLKK